MAKKRKTSRNDDYSEAELGAGLHKAHAAKNRAKEQLRTSQLYYHTTVPGGTMFMADRETVNALNRTAQIYAEYNVRNRAKPKNKRK